jgi:iron complex outermembrane receptor protein
MIAAMATGLINPFGPSGPEGDALLASTQVSGDLHDAKGSTALADAKASREIYRLPGGPLVIAIGTEARRENLDDSFTSLLTSGDVLGAGGDRHPVSASRTAQALYAEAGIPFAKAWEGQLAARYDHYSDFGGTLNPKLALRWQPLTSLMLRASWGTGFRAPTLPDLFTPFSHGFTSDQAQDPLRCPVTGLPQDCGGSFPALMGGNPSLEPEKSKQLNAGVVWEPLPRLSMGLDYWRIHKTNTIGVVPEDSLFLYHDHFASNFVRGPPDATFPNLPGPIQTVLEWNQNLGSLVTAGFDIGVSYRGQATPLGRFGFALNGTYISEWQQQLDGVNYTSAVGNTVVGPIPRWRHQLALNWDSGPWGGTLVQTFQNGYSEPDILTCDDNGNCGNRRVGSYSVWDVQGSYAGFKNTKIVLGIRNLLDQAPPFTQASSGFFETAYDGAYADPRGRTYYARLTFTFR